MSTRFYPRFVKGNPQLRIFLPDYKMILVKAEKKMPDNVATFKVDPTMTDWDIKNYLEKIYKIQVKAVNSQIRAGEIYKLSDGVGKREDYKIAHVSMPIDQKFTWPNLFPEDKAKEEESERDNLIREALKDRDVDENNREVPRWFT